MESIEAISPLTGKVLDVYEMSTPEIITQQVHLARQATSAWSSIPVKRRIKLLSNFRIELLNQIDKVTDIIVSTTGKVKTEALLGEIYPVLELAKYYEKNARSILRYQGVPTPQSVFPGSMAHIEHRPFGVVAIISPWNYPFQLTVIPLLSALFAGNAVIFKISELSLPIGRLIVDLFASLGLPDNLIQWTIGKGTESELLIDAKPDMVFFTGGTETGKAVMARCANHLIPVILELGGKDPMIVFEDAQLERACHAAVYGAFSNSGQACISVERLYVEDTVYEDFVERLCSAVNALKLGQNGDVGPIISARQFEVYERHYHDAIKKGAQVSGPLERNGHYLKPVILWNINHDMSIMQEETFGPLLPVMSFSTEQEVIERANDSIYGLNASIWSSDAVKVRRVAQQLQTSAFVINDVLKNAGHPGLPFGGVKQSGFGRYRGAEGLLSFTYRVSGFVCENRYEKEPNWFPYSDRLFDEFKGFIDFIHSNESIVSRMKNNREALEAFKSYSAFNLKQHWCNFLLSLPRRRNY